MTFTTGLLVADRHSDKMWLNLPDTERIPLLSYRGFDASHRWPHADPSIRLLIKDELAPIESIDVIRSYYKSVRLLTGTSIDFIAIGNVEASLHEPKMSFIGFDIGLLADCGEPLFFSIIINEIRIQGNPIYREFIPTLNKYYLFDSFSLARKALQARENALQSGNHNHIETAYPSPRDIVKIYSCT